MEDVFKLLKDDHEKVKKLFKKYEGCGQKALKEKQTIADTVFRELEIHAKVEEEIFYPAVKDNASEEGQDLVNEAFEEHKIVKTLIKELQALKAGDDPFEAKFKVLRENVEHHIEEEEDELFPEARKAIKGEMEEITEEVEERKEDLEAGA
jgi:hemerythrin-like domain-containing protein